MIKSAVHCSSSLIEDDGAVLKMMSGVTASNYAFSSDDQGDRVVMSTSDETPTNPTEEFALPIGTGMRRVPSGAGAEFDSETTERLMNRLDEFDAVRTRGEVESRSVHLGGQPPR